METEHPVVFMSYSHDSDEHKQWVRKLATQLRQNGVDVVLDQWDLHIGQDLRFFMEQGIDNSKKVICVCSENYVIKANTGTGGTGYESMIISQDLLRDVNTEYIIPLVRNNPSDKKTPTCLGTKLYTDFEKDSEYFSKYRELLERIYEYDKTHKPLLGENPFKGRIASEIDIKTKIARTMYYAEADFGRETFEYGNNDGRYFIGTGEYRFETKWSSASNECIHAYGEIGYMPGCTEFPQYDEIGDFDFTSHTRTIYKDEIVIFKNPHGKFLAIKVLSVESKSHGREKDEMVFEYKVVRENI